MEPADVQISVDGAVATIALHRPAARNAITPAMLDGLVAALQGFAASADVRVVVLRGAGELPFSAGYDMGELPPAPLSAVDARAIHAPIRRAAQALLDSPQIVVGAARRFVYGSALDLFAHCDLRLCVDGCQFCMPPNRHGFLYPDAGLARLLQVAGHALATDLLYTSQPVDSMRARAAGLVQRVSAPEAFEADLQSLCQDIVRNVPMSLWETKRAVARLAPTGAAAGAGEDAMYDRIARCLNSADCQEAQQAFREKREPRFANQRPPASTDDQETAP